MGGIPKLSTPRELRPGHLPGEKNPVNNLKFVCFAPMRHVVFWCRRFPRRRFPPSFSTRRHFFAPAKSTRHSGIALESAEQEGAIMDLELGGKTILVTGSTAGIGLAIAVALAREAASVVLNGRSQKRVSEAVERVQRAAPEAEVKGIAADLGTRPGVDELLRQLPQVEVLVNNLGIFEAKPFPAIPDEDWMRIFETNVMSGVRLSRHYLPRMLEKNWGRIVFVSSESAVQIPAEMVHYGVTKTAQIALARGLAETTVGTGVTVNSVLPGPTMSEGVGTFVEGLARQQNTDAKHVEEQFFQTIRPTSLLKRFETPEEVANLVAFVCSPLSSGTNGAALRVDGGVVRSIL
jgi:NAD(P)-dependent dehydrogenase (short-subunit alcohol dehydrogenase family)